MMKVGDLVRCSGIGIGMVIKMGYADTPQYASPVATVHWFRKGVFAWEDAASVESLACLEIISEA